MLEKLFGIHESALQLKAKRVEVLSQNIANADTPGYKARDIDFRDALRAELDQLVKDFQRDQAAMSEEDQVAARQKMASKQSDLEYVAKKLQTLQTQNAQRVMQELAPQAQEVLREIIETDQIGLLLQQQAVIHADLGYNITAKVSDKMNQLGAE